MSPLQQSRVADENPWWPTIRRAFGIPEHVSTTAAREAIARSLVKAVPGALPAGGEEMSLHSLMSSATAHVSAFVEAAREGELDLAICGHGQLSAAGEASVLDSAVAPMEARLRMLQKHRPWLDWLWTTFSDYVASHPCPTG